MELIDKASIVAEIRSRLHPVVVPHGTKYDDWDRGADSERLNILSFLDTLEVKEVDLEKEITSYIQDNTYNGYLRTDIHDAAEHFFKLGLKTKGE